MRVVVDAERETPVVLAPPAWPSHGETREKRSEGSERGGDRRRSKRVVSAYERHVRETLREKKEKEGLRLRADSNAPEDQGFPQLRLLALRVGIGLNPAGGRPSRR
jgi:hypothetical protein